jgi:cysteine desulfurase
MTRLRNKLETSLKAGFPTLVVNGQGVPRLPHTANLAFPEIDRQALFMALDMAGIACSSGSACASGSSEPSPVLLAMGLPATVVDSSLRFSLGMATSEWDIDQAVRRILLTVNNLQRQKQPENPPRPSRHRPSEPV